MSCFNGQQGLTNSDNKANPTTSVAASSVTVVTDKDTKSKCGDLFEQFLDELIMNISKSKSDLDSMLNDLPTGKLDAHYWHYNLDEQSSVILIGEKQSKHRCWRHIINYLFNNILPFKLESDIDAKLFIALSSRFGAEITTGAYI